MFIRCVCLSLLFLSASLVWSANSASFFGTSVESRAFLLDKIDAETESIALIVHRLTDRKVIHSLAAAKNRGVEVEVIIDHAKWQKRSPLDLLDEAGVTLRILKPSSKRKPLVVDYRFCIFGKKQPRLLILSADPLAHTPNSRHNCIWLHDQAMTNAYLDEFNNAKARAVPYAQMKESLARKK